MLLTCALLSCSLLIEPEIALLSLGEIQINFINKNLMLLLKWFYFINNMHMSVCGYVHMSAVCLGRTQEVIDPLELELEAVVSYGMQVLGTEPSFFARAMHALIHRVVPLAPGCFLTMPFYLLILSYF